MVTTHCGDTGIVVGAFVDGDKQCYNASGCGSGPPHRASSTLRARLQRLLGGLGCRKGDAQGRWPIL